MKSVWDEWVTSGVGGIDSELIPKLLTTYGLAVILQAQHLELDAIVDELGGVMRPQDAEGTLVWDIKPAATFSPVRSHNSLKFPLHTDCSYEEPPPRWIGLKVLRGDRNGGGLSTFVDGYELAHSLSPASVRALRMPAPVVVPPEFRRGGSINIDVPVLFEGGIRYRRDIFDDAGCTAEQLRAFDELDAACGDPSQVVSSLLPDGAILLLDNFRWFHARSAVADSQRHLLRVRFDTAN